MSDRTPPPDPRAEGPPGSAAGPSGTEPGRQRDDTVHADADDAVNDPAPAAGDPPAGGPVAEPVDDAADRAADDALEEAAEAVEVDLELLLAEREQYLDAFRRTQADFENYRKQVQKRQEDAVDRALGAFVQNLLPVLDSCDAALAHGASEVEPVLTALYTALGKEGLERIEPKGEPFDPSEADAVMHEPGDSGQQVVSEVLRPGYRWRGRVLRPAMVKVAG